MVTTPDFGLDGVSSSLAVHVLFSFLFFQLFFLYDVRNPDTTDNRQHTSRAGYVLQPDGYNAFHACRLPAEQEATPHACASLSGLYELLWLPINTCFCYGTPRSVGLRVSAAVIHAGSHWYYNTDISLRRTLRSYAYRYDTISHAVCFQIVLAPLP